MEENPPYEELEQRIQSLERDIAARKVVDKSLQESEAMFRALFEQAGGYCMLLQPTDNGIPDILDVNEAACKVHGYTRHEMIGRPVADLDDEEGKRLCRERTKIILSGKTLAIQTNHVRKDGTVFPVAVFANKIQLEGKPPIIMTTEHDISDIRQAEDEKQLAQTQKEEVEAKRKVAEEKLLDSDKLWQSIMAAATETVLVITIQGIIISANEVYAKRFGRTVEDLIGTNVFDLMPDDVAEQRRQQLDEVVKTKRAVYFEDSRAGMQFNNSLYPILDERGDVYKIIIFAVEVTERKRAEEALEAQQVFRDAVLDCTANGIVACDQRGILSYFNEASRKLHGLPAKPVPPEKWAEYYDLYETDGMTPLTLENIPLFKALKGEKVSNQEIVIAPKGVPARTVSVTGRRLIDSKGNQLGAVISMNDITERKQVESARYLAYHDPLTKLPNRLLFNDRLEHTLERAHREKFEVGVMFIDVDNFKSINDGLGHAAGDSVLQSVASNLASHVREEDTVARIAGDEFAVILEKITDSENAAHVAGKILLAFDTPMQIEGQELRVTMSIGISLFPKDSVEANTLIKHADVAMYRAKEKGKNQYCFYTVDLTDAAKERLKLENDLRRAMQQDEFRVYYQPQYSLTTGDLIGAEALVRWQHPEIGLVSPTQFISIAERIGLIIPLGKWVLTKACAQARAWQDMGLNLERISVNVAVQQIQSDDFVQVVKTILEESGIEPQYLELELTESSIMLHAESAISTLQELRRLGVCLAIDDFGTGYSSLSYLKRLPINKLKIDRSFIRDIPQDANDESITKAIIALGKSLQLKATAEGVETEEQKVFVSIEGCDEVQGFYYSRPLPEGDFEELLESVE